MHSSKFWSPFNKIILAGLIFVSQYSSAIVNVDRTRVIIDSGKNSTSFNLINEATDKPALVQIWIDDGDPTLAPEKIKSPVWVADPIFRLEAYEQRNVKLILPNAQSIKSDRETLYWLNILQVPAVPEIEPNQQRVILPLRLRLKLLVRPAQVGTPVQKDMNELQFQQQGLKLIVNNPTPWNITITGAHTDTQQLSDFLVPAKGQYTTNLDHPIQTDTPIKLNVINDAGTLWPIELKIK